MRVTPVREKEIKSMMETKTIKNVDVWADHYDLKITFTDGSTLIMFASGRDVDTIEVIYEANS